MYLYYKGCYILITRGNKRLGHQKTILSLHALFCGKVSKLNNQRSSTLWNDACNFRRNRTCFNKPVHVLFTCKLQFFCAALLTFKIKINPVFSKPLFFESPVNSNQMQFPSPQSKTNFIPDVSNWPSFPTNFYLSWKMEISGFHCKC